MTYETERDDEELRYLDDEITHFISRYSGNLSNTNRKTVILFPGGMGSQLLQASTPPSAGPPYSYNIVWFDCSDIFGGAAVHLRMQGDIDFDGQFVIADGPVNFPPLTPYQGFIDWCNQQQIDYLIYGWDWRRDLCRTADFFLKVFMPRFKKRVRNLYPSPLQRLSLVGHSFGGMLIKLILNNTNNAIVQRLKSAVTVASPFYGYGGQLPHYFVGDPYLNPLYGSRTVTRIVSSLAAGYTLQFLDWDTFQRDGGMLAQDPDYPLLNYPILDATNGTPADPYNPQTNGAQVRYPQLYGFDWGMLGDGKAVYHKVAAPLLDTRINDKFFNIRGVTTNNGVDLNETVTHQTWGWIDPNFDPNNTNNSPITDYLGPGDGTLPAWSTRFAYAPAANVRTLWGDDIDHMFMMNNSQVFNELLTVI
jgi:pimeloyl-ACP methyl ester carboxylesterase